VEELKRVMVGVVEGRKMEVTEMVWAMGLLGSGDPVVTMVSG